MLSTSAVSVQFSLYRISSSALRGMIEQSTPLTTLTGSGSMVSPTEFFLGAGFGAEALGAAPEVGVISEL